MAALRRSASGRPHRRLELGLERLDTRQLLSLSGFGPHLGHFVAPGSVFRPQQLRPTLQIDPHAAINRQLLTLLGPGMDRIERNAELNQVWHKSALPQHVLGNSFIHAIFGDNDTYTLLNSPWLASVLTSQQLSTNSADQTVTLHLPKTDIVSLGTPTTILVHPGDPAPGPPGTTFVNGFLVQVAPTDVIFDADNQHIDVQVPLSEIPTGALQLTTNSPNNLVSIYNSTGTLLQSLFRSGLGRTAPTGLPTVPGLRLLSFFDRNHNFPDPNHSRVFLQMRVAANQNLLALNSDQTNLLNQGLTQFLTAVDNWNTLAPSQFSQLIAAQPPGQVPPRPVRGPLRNTVAVTAGVIQQPNVVQLNAPERIDVGFIFARNGDYGIILSARGPLSNTTPVAPANTIGGGDLQTEVSNAQSLDQLGGWRIVEGLTEGSILAAGLAATNSNGVATFAASAGYGAGLEWGLGVRFTQVIPLGNFFSGPIP